ncbi:MAG: hypothetical protein JO263_01440 [Candidatus Eremiobacteraeota bacterium]|nr:hypothetical protein [Candidatus Eremiobacteraeota bacterium]
MAIRPAIVCAIAFGVAACGGTNAGTSTTGAIPARPAPAIPAAKRKIKHVVIVIQENRSFNNLFYGYPGALTKKHGYDSYGKRIKLLPVPLETTWDIEHSSDGFFKACNGTGSIPGTNCRMNGFNNELVTCTPSGSNPCPIKYPPYAYVPHAETKPYFDMAANYVLADQMYASNFDTSSFVSHQYIISAQANGSVNYPFQINWGCSGGSGDQIATLGPQRQIPNGYEQVCWDVPTLADELDQAKLPWAYYAETYSSRWGIWSAYQVIKHIYYGQDWSKDVFSPPAQFLTDVAAGNLRTVTWIAPTCANSDHAGCGSNTGPAWVASIVNAIGTSKFWKSAAIFVFWDDYGGWYDSQPPAYVDYDGLGFRLPMLIISPYAKKGYVSHVHYEHGSILKFVEDQFGLGRLSASDARANSPAPDCFDFNQSPRPFEIIPSPHDARFFLHQAPDNRIPDAE